ncbi:MAG: hypothetical protein VW475_11395, partial [Curvibacter sp.]
MNPPSATARPAPLGTQRIFTVVLVYAGFAALWILLSDRAVNWLFKEPGLILLASTLKGWVFVAVTSALLFFMLRARPGPAEALLEPGPVRRRPLAVFTLLAVAVTALVVLAVWNGLREEKEKAYAQLLAISESKSRELWTWHQERLSDAAWAQRSVYLRQQWLLWRERSDPVVGLRLQQFLGSFSKDAGATFPHVEIIDVQGRRAFDSNEPDRLVGRPDEAPFTEPALHLEVLRALTLAEPRRAGP